MDYTCEFGKKLKELRKARYSQHPQKFIYCKSQETFARELGYERFTCTNWENNKTLPSLDVFTQICNLLYCDPNYMLTESSTISEKIAYISKELKLSVSAVEQIKYNDFLSSFLNFLLESNGLAQLIDKIQEFSLTEYICREILQTSFESNFKNKIEKIFSKFYIETAPLDRNEANYETYLKKELPLETIHGTYGTLDNYLKYCISEDTYNQISINSEYYNIKSEEQLYELFIKDLTSRTFDILSTRHIRDFHLNQITQTFCNLLVDFQYNTHYQKNSH